MHLITKSKKAVRINSRLFYLYLDKSKEIAYTYDNNGNILTKNVDGVVTDYKYNEGSDQLFSCGNNRYVYDAWGNHVVYTYDDKGDLTTDPTHVGNVNPFRYRGYYFDTETNLYYLKSRYYDPVVGRFISIDSIEYIAPETINGLNLYAYCRNNPIMYIDPNGNYAITALLIGMLIGLIIGALSYTAGQVIEYAESGTFEWSWGGFIGSTIGGAIAGAISSIPWLNVVVSSGISGLITTFSTMLGENISGDATYSFGEMVSTSLFASAISMAAAGILDKIKIPHLNFGSGNFKLISDQVYKNLYNRLIKTISVKTFFKMLAVDAYYSSLGDIINGVLPLNDIVKGVLSWIFG